MARALAGWSVADGRYVTEGVNTARTGRFGHIEACYDPYQRRVLGVGFPPHAGPMECGERLLCVLARHPGTARFVCAKIARRLLSDRPPEGLVADLAAVFLVASDAPDQIAPVVRALVLHPGFAATPPQKLRCPFEFPAALYRATGAEVTGADTAFRWQLMRAGGRQRENGPPTGHPDTTDKWVGGICAEPGGGSGALFP